MPTGLPALPRSGSSRVISRGSFILRAYGALAVAAAVVVGATFLYAWVDPIPHQDWYETPLGGQSASTVALTRDASGALHVAYTRSGLYYLTNQSGAWVSHLVDNDSACCASIAVDSVGRVHLAYTAWNRSHPPVYLRYAVVDHQAVGVTTLLSATYIVSPSLAIDSHGHLHLSWIAYEERDTNESLMYASDETGSLKISIAANYSWQFLFSDSLVLDSQDEAHIAVGLAPDQGSVGILNRVGNAWEFEPVDHSADWVDSVSFALDSSGHRHLAYPYLATLTGTTYLRYATDAGGEWDRVDVAAAPNRYETMTLDASGHPHILFSLNSTLVHASDVSGAWRATQVSRASGYDEWYSYGIAAGPGGQIHVVAVRPSSGQSIEYYSNVPPPVIFQTYVNRAAPFLTWEALGASVAGIAVPAYVGFQSLLRVHRERKKWAAAKYQELLRRR